MLLIIIKSCLIGLTVGILYGTFFASNLKKIFSVQQNPENRMNKKQILKLISFYIALHLLLVGVFVLLIFKTKTNIIATLACFTISFWYYILVKTKPKKK